MFTIRNREKVIVIILLLLTLWTASAEGAKSVSKATSSKESKVEKKKSKKSMEEKRQDGTSGSYEEYLQLLEQQYGIPVRGDASSSPELSEAHRARQGEALKEATGPGMTIHNWYHIEASDEEVKAFHMARRVQDRIDQLSVTVANEKVKLKKENRKKKMEIMKKRDHVLHQMDGFWYHTLLDVQNRFHVLGVCDPFTTEPYTDVLLLATFLEKMQCNIEELHDYQDASHLRSYFRLEMKFHPHHPLATLKKKTGDEYLCSIIFDDDESKNTNEKEKEFPIKKSSFVAYAPADGGQLLEEEEWLQLVDRGSQINFYEDVLQGTRVRDREEKDDDAVKAFPLIRSNSLLYMFASRSHLLTHLSLAQRQALREKMLRFIVSFCSSVYDQPLIHYEQSNAFLEEHF